MFSLFRKELSSDEKEYLCLANCACTACSERRKVLLSKIGSSRVEYIKELRLEEIANS